MKYLSSKPDNTAFNQEEKFNYDWEFAKSPVETPYSLEQIKELTFEKVTLPHDWLIYQTKDLYESATGWYRKSFDLEVEKDASYRIRFDGVYMDYTIYVNGEKAGTYKNGYVSSSFDITSFLVQGTNEILVRVCHQSPNSRWYSGAGIYRNVWLIKEHKNHIQPQSLYVHTNQSGELFEVEIEANVTSSGEVILKHTIMDQGEMVCSTASKVSEVQNKQVVTVTSPEKWSPENPKLYQIVTELIGKERCYHKIVTNIGFKSVQMNPNQGFILNGVQTKLNGVCEHHDLGCLGAVFNKEAMRIRLQILKEMGVNSIRTAHNAPAPELMDLADEMGFLMVSEMFDMWKKPKTEFDFARFFDEWVERDIANWVKRDRNHVSLIMWSIGNEIYDTHVDASGQDLTKMLSALVKENDPKGNGVPTIGSNFMQWENAQKCADILKYAGYNYAERLYEEHHLKHPDWVIYGSETASIVQSRGIYHFPIEASILSDDDRQCSALGNSQTSWGAKSYEQVITLDRDMPFSMGQYLWTGFDYIGEPTPYSTKNSYFGQLDTAEFPKDSFYVYQAAWTDYKQAPMIHIFPHWKFNAMQMVDVRVCTNAPKFKLFLNGRLIEERTINKTIDKALLPTWKIPFEEGELTAIAYDFDDTEIAKCTRNSYGEAIKIEVLSGKRNMMADAEDVVRLGIQVLDANGNVVEDARTPIKVEVEGPGVLLGLDNGDSTDYDPYKGNVRKLFSGKLKALIGSTLDAGIIKVHISAKEMETVTLLIASEEVLLNHEKSEFKLNAPGSDLRAGIARYVNTDEGQKVFESIPVERVELLCPKDFKFGKSCKEIEIPVKIYPSNAKDYEITWRITNEMGVTSNIAKVEPTKDGCKLAALGDGSFFLKCQVNNGKEHPDFISQMEFYAEDLGIAYKDPYEFVSGGLYDDNIGELAAGNERGIATGQTGRTAIIFKDVNFGDFGTDILTLPIFAFDSKPIYIELWQGIASMDGKEDSENFMIDRVVYDKVTIWDTYQEETYKLKRRISGVQTISIVIETLETRVQLKGFQFEKLTKAFEKLSILECSSFYGDSFKKEDWGMAEIGNNVSFIFEDMNFDEPCSKIEICGRSITEKNTIRLQVITGEEQQVQVLEFLHTEDFDIQTYDIGKVFGKSRVEFIFLPGSRFDFKWFRFIRE